MTKVNIDNTHSVTNKSREDAFFADIVPEDPTSAGKAGELAYDENYFYYCYADNQWAALTGMTF